MSVNEAKAFALPVGQSISTARHQQPPGTLPHLNHVKALTETGNPPAARNQRLSRRMRMMLEIAMEA